MNPNETKEVIIRFDKVSFKYDDKKVTLEEANFTVRKNSKITIMGQNGAGKSTIFKLLTGEIQPQEGKINIELGAKIGIAKQMVEPEKLDLSVREYFQSAFTGKIHDLDKHIAKVLDVVNLKVSLDKKVRELSGGQKARLLLAFALIQDPDILLLDEPTNNLDYEGISHLTYFLMNYTKTVIVISHDAEFLNAFTDGVINLDINTHKTEQFVGDYHNVVYQIAQQIERERLQNARIEKSIRDRFEKVNKLGGKSVAMRRLAVKIREDIEDDRENIVDVRKEDRTIPEFTIEAQHYPKPLITISEVTALKDGEPKTKKVHLELRRGQRLLITGPNGIGKSTLLKSIIAGRGATIPSEVRVGYYSQDFSELDFNQTGLESLKSVSQTMNPTEIYAAAGRMLLNGELLNNKVGSYSEGQKGLLCYARFVLQQPGLLIMDEPTNHLNFRHIPVIAQALNEYAGAMILVSHLGEFLGQISVNEYLDLDD
jgi:ATP-binding cassette, subfamily F, member 3